MSTKVIAPIVKGLTAPTLLHRLQHDGIVPTKPNRVTAVTLFSGLGSSSKALRDLGYSVRAHDFMPEACASLRSNGFDVVQGDIRAVDFTDPAYADTEIVVGGPPCQPFSQGGRNAGEDDPRDMIPDFIRCVRDTRPRLFILENVRGLAGPRHSPYLNRRVEELRALGYSVDWRVLDAHDYGAGQARKRLFIIGRRDSAYFPADRIPIRPIAPVWPAKRPGTTMAKTLGWTRGTCIERNRLAPAAAHDPEAAQWPMTRPSTTVVGSFKPECQAAPGYRSTGDGPRQNAPGTVVTTPEERLILQQMPKHWIVAGSKSKVDLQIGNSCPNGVLRALVEANL